MFFVLERDNFDRFIIRGNPDGYETLEDLRNDAENDDDMLDAAIFEFKGFI